MKCPKCSEGDLTVRQGNGRDPDTGYMDEDYAFCPACGDTFDFADLDREMEQDPETVRSAA